MASLPARAADKDQSLQVALSRMLAEYEAAVRAGLPVGPPAVPAHVSREPDEPGAARLDPHVTAVRRLAPVAAQYAAFPDSMDERLRKALVARGLGELYTHQAESIDHSLAGRHVVVV